MEGSGSHGNGERFDWANLFGGFFLRQGLTVAHACCDPPVPVPSTGLPPAAAPSLVCTPEKLNL